MNIGAMIKKFRKERDITQEKLAEYLNVSPQAVSRWETGTAYPEITTIPAIATFLKISTDTLFGIDENKREERRQAYFTEYKRLQATGEIQKRLALSKKAKNDFLGDFRVLSNYAWDLAESPYIGLDGKCVMTPEELKTCFDEVLAICQTILDDCTDDEVRYRIISLQIMVYKSMKDDELALAQAIETANRLPGHLLSKDAELTGIYGYDTEEDIMFHQRYAQELVTCLWWEMRGMVCIRNPPEHRAAICKKALALYQLIYENEDYGFDEQMVAQIYEILAKIYLETKQYDLALDATEQHVRHSLKHADILCNGFAYTSAMFNHLTFERENYVRGYTETAQEKLLHYLKDSAYDEIRQTKRFQALLAELKTFTHINNF